MGASWWAQQRFGPAAPEFVLVVPAAIARAHADAVAAQDSSGTKKQDPYGHTLKNRQHECLVEAAADLPGLETFQPVGASFELLRVSATGVVLYPWRYATSSAQPRQTARMRVSSFRQGLLAGEVAGHRQLTFDEHADLSPEELDAQLAEEAAVLEELGTIARVVIVGYASNSQALLALGWGDATLVDSPRGTVVWGHWESLPLSGRAAGDARTGTGGADPQPPLRGSDGGSALRSAERWPRFDDAPIEDDEFGITARPPLDGEPVQEPGLPVQDTGTEEPSEDDRP